MTSRNRKHCGIATQAPAAAWFRDHGFPHAMDAGPGRAGRDLLNLVGLAGVVNARSGFSPLAWIRRAVAAAADDLRFVVLTCNAQGARAIADWPALLRLDDFTTLVRAAGFGDLMLEPQ
jgi:hypothetical protein